MPHARPRKLRPQHGGGVILDISWFTEDPTDDPDKQPDLHDAVEIKVPTVADVTTEMIEDAIASRLAFAEVELGAAPEPAPAARAMLGKVYDGAATSAAVEARKAVKRG